MRIYISFVFHFLRLRFDAIYGSRIFNIEKEEIKFIMLIEIGVFFVENIFEIDWKRNVQISTITVVFFLIGIYFLFLCISG